MTYVQVKKQTKTRELDLQDDWTWREAGGDKVAVGKPAKAEKAFLSFLARNPCADALTAAAAAAAAD